MDAARESYSSTFQDDYKSKYEEDHKLRVEVALANDTSEDACWDKWDAHYSEKYPYEPKPVTIPESVLAKLKKDIVAKVVTAFCKETGMANNHSWFPYQFIAEFGNWKPVYEDGKINVRNTLLANTKGNSFNTGLLMLAITSRAPLFEGVPKTVRQYKSPINPLVPVIMAGFKQGQNIPYSDWGRDDLYLVAGTDLAEAMLCELPKLSVGELLTIRNNCLTDKTGARAGIPNNPATCIKLNGINETALAHLPKLAKYMAIQTWCAHPENWTEYSVIDPSNWDTKPDQLVKVVVSTTAKNFFEPKPANNSPFDFI